MIFSLFARPWLIDRAYSENTGCSVCFGTPSGPILIADLTTPADVNCAATFGHTMTLYDSEFAKSRDKATVATFKPCDDPHGSLRNGLNAGGQFHDPTCALLVIP